MYKIQVLNKISQKGLQNLPEDMYTISSEIENPDAIILRSYNMHGMELPESLIAIARAGAGVNNIPVENCTQKGIVVFNTPGANANAVKELVIAALLLSSRRIIEAIEWVKTLKGKGDEIPALVEKGKSNFVGPEIKGKRLGVIGLGSIGVMVANSARAIGMDVMGYDPFISVQAAWGLSRAVNRAPDLDTLLSTSDYISIHIPLMDKTRNIINKESFVKMKKGVRLLNFSRGGLINRQDLLEALKDGTVARYVTDFPTEELLHEENVIAIPHLGASTPESEENCAEMAACQLHDYLTNGNIKNSVNFPDCEMARTEGTTRITLAHKNIPNMVGQITAILASADINISHMNNRSKADYAYTMLDIDNGDVSPDILSRLSDIKGVVKVRVI